MNTVNLLPTVSLLALLLLPSCEGKVQSRSASFPHNIKVNVVLREQGKEYKKLTNRTENYTRTFDLSTVTLTKDKFEICRKTSSTIQSTYTTYEADQDYCNSSYMINEWDGNRFLGSYVSMGNVGWVEVCQVYDTKIECRSVYKDAPPEAIANPDKYKKFITASTTYTIR